MIAFRDGFERFSLENLPKTPSKKCPFFGSFFWANKKMNKKTNATVRGLNMSFSKMTAFKASNQAYFNL